MAITTRNVPIPATERPVRAASGKTASVAWPRQKIISDSFRLATFGAALLQMAAFPSGPGYDASGLTGLIAVAAGYSVLKIAQPFKWQRERAVNTVLLTIDMIAAALLVHFSGSIHSPFILYTLVPVLTAALLKDYAVTAIVSIATGAYVMAGYVYNPVSLNTPTLQAVNDFLVYMIALGLVASLPYSINLSVSRRLRSVAATEERVRISRELHDSVCQALCGLRWQIQRLSRSEQTDRNVSEELKKMEAAVESAEQDARELLHVLHAFNTGAGFISHVKGHLEQLKDDTGIDYHLDSDGADLRMDAFVERELTMICSEALTNIKKHSRARNVRFSARTIDGHVRITIADDGVGFVESGTSPTGYGLSVMRGRAASLGGTLSVSSAPGEGSIVEVELPRWPDDDV